MNEEEIIEKCKIFIDLYNGDSDWDIQDTKEAIQVLLNLYNQEKEKNKKLEEGIRQIKDKLEIADYYNCQDGADELTRLLQES